MFSPTLLAFLAALPTILAQNVTGSAFRCTTSYGYQPLSAGTTVTTWYNKTTTTAYFTSTSTVHATVIVTPSASTVTAMMTTTAVVEVTSTSTPVPTTIPTPTNFLPLFAFVPQATGMSRVKRTSYESADHEFALQIFRRQTLANNTGGFAVDRSGKTSSIYRKFAHRVDCRIMYTINRTSLEVATGLPETSFVAGATAVVMSTVTVSTTTTVVSVKARETKYAACMGNNVGKSELLLSCD